MQGQRTDMKYPQILKYIEKNQPISVAKLHKYLETKHAMVVGTSRTRILSKLQKLGLIKRIGRLQSNQAEFCLTQYVYFTDPIFTINPVTI